MDLGYQGTKFTWSDGRVGAAHIKERIDRVWRNKQWSLRFSNHFILHLTRVASDHHPLWLGCPLSTSQSKFTGFRFMKSWFVHPEFWDKVEKFWKQEPCDLHQDMEAFGVAFGDGTMNTLATFF